MTREPAAAGDVLPDTCQNIEVRVAELRQLFNAIDPSPFCERDLDPRAEEFIVEWTKDLHRDAPLALTVHLERGAGPADEGLVLQEAIREFFGRRASSVRRKLRELFRRGRISLVIAAAFLTLSATLADAIASAFPQAGFERTLREGLLIVGWVAMWRPLDVFLYDWWPIRAEARLFDRLSQMPVRLAYQETVPTDAWRRDWPTVPLATRRT